MPSDARARLRPEQIDYEAFAQAVHDLTEMHREQRQKSDTVRFALRLREHLRARLEQSARHRKVSINQEIVDRLGRSLDADKDAEASNYLADLLAEVRTIRMMMEADRVR